MHQFTRHDIRFRGLQKGEVNRLGQCRALQPLSEPILGALLEERQADLSLYVDTDRQLQAGPVSSLGASLSLIHIHPHSFHLSS